jgi:hypothetical protein
LSVEQKSWAAGFWGWSTASLVVARRILGSIDLRQNRDRHDDRVGRPPHSSWSARFWAWSTAALVVARTILGSVDLRKIVMATIFA